MTGTFNSEEPMYTKPYSALAHATIGKVQGMTRLDIVSTRCGLIAPGLIDELKQLYSASEIKNQ
jgi:hypothetical protein